MQKMHILTCVAVLVCGAGVANAKTVTEEQKRLIVEQGRVEAQNAKDQANQTRKAKLNELKELVQSGEMVLTNCNAEAKAIEKLAMSQKFEDQVRAQELVRILPEENCDPGHTRSWLLLQNATREEAFSASGFMDGYVAYGYGYFSDIEFPSYVSCVRAWENIKKIKGSYYLKGFCLDKATGNAAYID